MSAPDSEADEALIVLTADPAAAGQRLDQWLAGALAPDLLAQPPPGADPRRRGDRRRPVATEPKTKVGRGEIASRWRLPEPEPAEPAGRGHPARRSCTRTPDLIVIDKPAGLVVHPGAGNWTGTLVNALIHHCGDSLSGIGGVRRPGIVHRLDKETSGVMVVAKTDAAHKALSEAFADHGRSGDLERAYVALVWGAPRGSTGTVDAPLGRAADRVRRAVVRAEAATTPATP